MKKQTVQARRSNAEDMQDVDSAMESIHGQMESVNDDEEDIGNLSDEDEPDPINPVDELISTEISCVQDAISDNTSKVSTVSNVNNCEKEKAMRHFSERQIKDGAALENKEQEKRHFRQMGREHLWSKVKFINSYEKLSWNGAMAKFMYKLCDIQRDDRKDFWDAYSPELRGLIGSKRAQVSKSIGERFKSKY